MLVFMPSSMRVKSQAPSALLYCKHRPESASRPAPGIFVTVFQALRDQANKLAVADLEGRRALGHYMNLARMLLKVYALDLS